MEHQNILWSKSAQLKMQKHQICQYVSMLLPSLFAAETNNIFPSALFVEI